MPSSRRFDTIRLVTYIITILTAVIYGFIIGANTVEPVTITEFRYIEKEIEVPVEVEKIVEVKTECDNETNTAITDITTDNTAQLNEYETFTATAYTADCVGCIGITKSGYDVRNTVLSPKGYRVIAVDPSVIPLGALVEVVLADGESFTARALDIGGAIKGNRIDILKSSRDKALQFGRQDVELKIIE